MNHINNGPYQLLIKDPTTKIKAKTLSQLKVLKDDEFIDNKLYYYLKPTDSPVPRFYGQLKIHKSGELFHIVTARCTILANTKLTFLKLMLKMKITTPRILPRFSTTSEMLPMKMTR